MARRIEITTKERSLAQNGILKAFTKNKLRMQLPLEILCRVAVYMENPTPLCLACKVVNEKVSVPNLKEKWIEYHYRNVWKSYIGAYRQLAGRQHDLQLDKSKIRFYRIMKEPLFFHMIKNHNIHLNVWGEMALDRNYHRCFEYLLKIAPDSISLRNITSKALLLGNLSVVEILVEKFDQSISSCASIFSWAKFLILNLSSENEEIGVQILMKMSKNLEKRVKSQFLTFCIHVAVTRPSSSLLETLIRDCECQIQDLQINWVVLSEKNCLFLLQASLVAEKISISTPTSPYLATLIDFIISQDFSSSLQYLISQGLKVDCTILVKIISRNSLNCFTIIQSSPLLSNDQIIDKVIRSGRLDMVGILVQKYWSSMQCKNAMYAAIESDRPRVLQIILQGKPELRTDKEALYLAMTPGLGQIRNDQGQSCLQVLLSTNPDIVKAIEVGTRALRAVGDFVTTNVN